VEKGDTIYFYYSGHGVPDQKTKEAYILAKDVVANLVNEDSRFRLSYFYKKLAYSNASKVVAFIDACFSGKTDNKSIFKGVAPGLLRTKKVKVDKKKMIVMTAGKNNQFSNSFDKKKHRMFSYYLIKSLLSNKRLNPKSIFSDVYSKVKKSSWKEKGDTYLQEPQIYGNRKLGF